MRCGDIPLRTVYLPYISPISPLYLPISPISPLYLGLAQQAGAHAGEQLGGAAAWAEI